MTGEDFLRSLSGKPVSPAYLFIGPEPYMRARCRSAILDKVLPAEDRDNGLSRHDLSETELSVALDDARSFSLFASDRVIWISSAEGALPRRASADGEDGGAGKESAAQIADYLKNAPDRVVVVFDCSRYEFEGDDKAKLQRVQKFYGAVPVHVEFQNFTAPAARKFAQQLAREKELKIGDAEIELLVEALGSSAAGLANEIEKLALYAGTTRRITPEDIWQLVPSAKASTIFGLVNALGRCDRKASLDSLNILIREGEYLPLALSFLNTQFRLALIAKEAKLTNANQVQAFFTKRGTAMWRSRAEQVAQTAGAFSLPKLREAVAELYRTDKALRDTRPDDRTVVEQLVFTLTSS
ncbi:MAG TPA: DNA polymerase III subunit delta [Bryobacteraceae bacterium]|nr:DNA polymerase III subunit delta [Bryobacteraceae bacterium]